MNIFIGIGNLTRDPETVTTGSGKTVCKFTLAVKNYGDKSSFLDCEAWGKPGEIAQQYVKKGDPLGITAEVKQETWEKDGVKRSKIVFNVSKVELLQRREKSPSVAPSPKINDIKNTFQGEIVDDNFADDLPF